MSERLRPLHSSVARDRLNRVYGMSRIKLTEEQREAIMAMADKCPVHRTLSGNLEISTEPE